MTMVKFQVGTLANAAHVDNDCIINIIFLTSGT